MVGQMGFGAGAGASAEVGMLFTASTEGIENGLQRINKSFGAAQGVISSFVGAISFVGLVRGISELASESVKFDRIGTGFQALANRFNLSSQGIIDNIKEITSGQISTVQTMESVNKALTLLPGSAQHITELTTIATGAAAALGLDVKKAFDDIMTGLGRASPKILDNLGIIVNAREAYKAYAASIGVTVTSLTAEEKQTALMTMVIDSNIERFSLIAHAVRPDVFQQAGAALTDLKIKIGDLFAPTFRDALDWFVKTVGTTGPELEHAARGVAAVVREIISLGTALVGMRLYDNIVTGLVIPWQKNAIAVKESTVQLREYQTAIAQLKSGVMPTAFPAAFLATKGGGAAAAELGTAQAALGPAEQEVKAATDAYNNMVSAAGRAVQTQKQQIDSFLGSAKASSFEYTNLTLAVQKHAEATGKDTTEILKGIVSGDVKTAKMKEYSESVKQQSQDLLVGVQAAEKDAEVNSKILGPAIDRVKEAQVQAGIATTNMGVAIKKAGVAAEEGAAATAAAAAKAKAAIMGIAWQIGIFIAISAAINLIITAFNTMTESVHRVEDALGKLNLLTETFASQRKGLLDLSDGMSLLANNYVNSLEQIKTINQKISISLIPGLPATSVEKQIPEPFSYTEVSKLGFTDKDVEDIKKYEVAVLKVKDDLKKAFDELLISERLTGEELQKTHLIEYINEFNRLIAVGTPSALEKAQAIYREFFRQAEIYQAQHLSGWERFGSFLGILLDTIDELAKHIWSLTQVVYYALKAFDSWGEPLQDHKKDMEDLRTAWGHLGDNITHTSAYGFGIYDDYQKKMAAGITNLGNAYADIEGSFSRQNSLLGDQLDAWDAIDSAAQKALDTSKEQLGNLQFFRDAGIISQKEYLTDALKNAKDSLEAIKKEIDSIRQLQSKPLSPAEIAGPEAGSAAGLLTLPSLSGPVLQEGMAEYIKKDILTLSQQLQIAEDKALSAREQIDSLQSALDALSTSDNNATDWMKKLQDAIAAGIKTFTDYQKAIRDVYREYISGDITSTEQIVKSEKALNDYRKGVLEGYADLLAKSPEQAAAFMSAVMAKAGDALGMSVDQYKNYLQGLVTVYDTLMERVKKDLDLIKKREEEGVATSKYQESIDKARGVYVGTRPESQEEINLKELQHELTLAEVTKSRLVSLELVASWSGKTLDLTKEKEAADKHILDLTRQVSIATEEVNKALVTQTATRLKTQFEDTLTYITNRYKRLGEDLKRIGEGLLGPSILQTAEALDKIKAKEKEILDLTKEQTKLMYYGDMAGANALSEPIKNANKELKILTDSFADVKSSSLDAYAAMKKAAEDYNKTMMSNVQNIVKSFALSVIKGDKGSMASGLIEGLGKLMINALEQSEKLMVQAAQDSMAKAQANYAQAQTVQQRASAMEALPSATAGAALASGATKFAATMGWIGVAIDVVSAIAGGMFNKQVKALELAQPLQVVVMNAISIKTPASTRALLSSSGTIFSSDYLNLITRGGVVTP